MGSNLSLTDRSNDQMFNNLLTVSENVIDRIEHGILGPFGSIRDKTEDIKYEQLKDLESQQEELNGVTMSEFMRAADELSDRIAPTTEIPCTSYFSKVAHCYKHNQGCQVDCWKEVADYVKCVEDKRMQIMTNRKKMETEAMKRANIKKLLKKKKRRKTKKEK